MEKKRDKPGPKPRSFKTIWSSNLAYAVGLLTADGCLSSNGRHINLTSKDIEQIELFIKLLGIKTKISNKRSSSGSWASQTQFGSVVFYKFLLGIGLTPAKSKNLREVLVPEEYFFDFLRGYFDGDGTSYSYFDPLFPKSYRFYIAFTSASPVYIQWLRESLSRKLSIKGHINRNKNNDYLQLRYSKKEAVKICRSMYYSENVPHLARKYLKIKESLGIIDEKRASGEMADALRSGRSGSNPVEVQLLSRPQKE